MPIILAWILFPVTCTEPNTTYYSEANKLVLYSVFSTLSNNISNFTGDFDPIAKLKFKNGCDA